MDSRLRGNDEKWRPTWFMSFPRKRESPHAGLDVPAAAARALGLPVVMIARPPPPPGERVDSVDAALAWVEALLPPR